MEQKLHLILQKLETLDELKQNVQSIHKQQDELKQDVQSIHKQQDELKKNVQSIHARQDELKQIVLALRDRQEESDAKIEALSMDMNKLHGIVAGHTELLNSIVDTQRRQERILETLALRSIEQETELREFKRIK